MSIDITDYNKLETFMTKCDEKVKKEYQHIICFGTLHNKNIQSDTEAQIAKLINGGNIMDIWKHDCLTQMLISSKQDNSILQYFKEPNPMVNFYPTYPKHKNRKYDFTYDMHSNTIEKVILSELYQVYQTNNKPISFCDRILYASFDYFKQSALISELNTL
eukprot:356885_1